MKRKLILCLSIVFALLISICCFSGCGEKTYTVKFLNYDGTVISSQTVAEGKLPNEPTETPVKAQDGEYRYEFIGWDKEVKKATKNVSYTAEFKSTKIYLVEFKDHLGEVIYSYYADEGATAEYAGETPTRTADEFKDYTFKGWNVELGAVNSVIEYTAEYSYEYKDAVLDDGDMIIGDRDWQGGKV